MWLACWALNPNFHELVRVHVNCIAEQVLLSQLFSPPGYNCQDNLKTS